MNLGTIIQEKVNALPLDLQEDVLEYVERPFSENLKAFEDEREQKVAKRLLAKGVISEIPEPVTDKKDDEVEMIEVEGEAASKLIIEERR